MVVTIGWSSIILFDPVRELDRCANLALVAIGTVGSREKSIGLAIFVCGARFTLAISSSI